MKFLAIPLILAAILALPSCKKDPAPAPAPQDPNVQENTVVTTAPNGMRVYTTPISPEERKNRQEIAERRAIDGKILSPGSIISVTPLRTGGRMHPEDVATSFNFVRSGFEFCHVNAMREDETLSGKIVLDMKRDSGEPIVTALQSEIKAPGFEDCIRKSATRWFLPNDSEFSAEIQFTAKPAMTIDELRRINRGGEAFDKSPGAAPGAPDAPAPGAPDAPDAGAPDAVAPAPAQP